MTNKTAFNTEDIISLKKEIIKTVTKHAQEHYPNGSGDIYLLLATLGQVAYEFAYRVLPNDKEDAQLSKEEMKILVQKYIEVSDETRKEIKPKIASEIMAASHFVSIISEYYARRRNEVIEELRRRES